MSAESQWDIQKTIYSALQSDEDLQSYLADGQNSVYDHVPDGAVYPYCVIGDMEARPLQTQGVEGMVVNVSVHSYSRNEGYKQLKVIMKSIYNSLHNAALTSDTQHIISCRFILSRIEHQKSSHLRMAEQIFEIITEPKP